MARSISRRRFLHGTLGATAVAPVAVARGSSRDRSTPTPAPPAQPPEPGDGPARGLVVGYGGLPNEAGLVQLDAMIMRGSDLEAGAVACLEGIATPIAVARKVMERTRHFYLVGAGARAFAEANGFELAVLREGEVEMRSVAPLS